MPFYFSRILFGCLEGMDEGLQAGGLEFSAKLVGFANSSRSTWDAAAIPKTDVTPTIVPMITLRLFAKSSSLRGAFGSKPSALVISLRPRSASGWDGGIGSTGISAEKTAGILKVEFVEKPCFFRR